MIAYRIGRIVKAVRTAGAYMQTPAAVKAECARDALGLVSQDPGVERSIDEGIMWLGLAQDRSMSADGGVARHYSLIDGWSTSYPETTGYIVPTMLAYARLRDDNTVRERAKRMLDWLISIQFLEGGFQGGRIDSTPKVPVTFNTGQILLGLASGVRELGMYREEMRRAADWLVATQDADGCWRKNPTPFAGPGEKAYETHVAWGLLEAARLLCRKDYEKAALANVHWALRSQHDNGWFENCCLDDPSRPLTHTLGYMLRGLVEAHNFTNDGAILDATKRTADGLLSALRADGSLPGRLYPNWTGAVKWSCLTGNVQIAYSWLLLYKCTGESRYRDAAYAANRYVRRTMKIDGSAETRGAIKGSFPVWGDYGSYQYLNWACKFFVDSNMLERDVRLLDSSPTDPSGREDNTV
jgi:hypothetical protein